MNPTVSIITATFNDGPFLNECIASVLNQDFDDWEWLIVNNGSTDDSCDIIDRQTDPRIISINLPKNIGVSGGRNAAMERARGDYFCFLDGDDILPKNSIGARLKKFDKPDLEFVDGKVLSFEGDVSNIIHTYAPNYTGNPLENLLSLNGLVFRGNTWMIKRVMDKSYAFDTRCTHGEELLLFASLADGGLYTFTDEPVLLYRQHKSSAMRNLDALNEGYLFILGEIRKMDHVPIRLVRAYQNRAQKMMFKAFILHGLFIKAIKSWFKFL